MKHLILIPAIVMLAACGGGGGGDTPVTGNSSNGQTTPAPSTPAPSEPAPSTPPPATTPTPAEPVAEAEPEETADLVSNKDFDFVGKNELTLSLNNNANTSRVYLNVCNDFTTVNGKVKVDYTTCQLRTTLPTGSVEYQLTIGGDVERLVAQVWAVEDGAEPENYYWTASQDSDTWSIQVN